MESLSIRRALGTESKGDLDLAKHLKFRLDGGQVDLLTSTSAGRNTAHAHIPPHTQRLLEIEVDDLPVGEHQVTLQFDTSNARDGTEPQLLLIVNVRHSILLAIGIMITGVIALNAAGGWAALNEGFAALGLAVIGNGLISPQLV